MDYKKLGLKCGLEIHQQLDTTKLFCSCPSELIDKEPDLVVKRKLHAVAGEMGEIDPAAMQAYLRDTTYIYQFYSDSNCLVELDEEPPHQMDKQALETVLKVALMLNSDIIDEIHVMRKTVIDGSNTSGFQRTALVAGNGQLVFNGTKIGVPTICIEEDAARIIETREKEIVYGLDRLGIPLIELATSPDIKSPAQARETALAIGSILRATGAVKRGIGTIRQDLNISIRDGARVEIKGIQDLNIIQISVENEAKRQVSLLEIRDDLALKKAGKASEAFTNVSDVFKDSNSKVIQTTLKNKGVVMALKLEKFAGLLGKEVQPGRRFGTELADYARAYGAGGLFHSDELPAYGIIEKDVERIKKALKMKERDAFVLIADRKEVCERALQAVVERANLAFEGVPEETRKSLPDGNTAYLRPLPGGKRMYPETDLKPIVVGSKYLAELKKNLPALPWKQIATIKKNFNLPDEIASELYDSSYFNVFQKSVNETKVEPKLIASTFTNIVPSLSDEVILQENQYIDLFKALEKNKFSKEAIPKLLKKWLEKPDNSLSDIISELGLGGLSDKKLEDVIEKIVAENKKLIEEKKEYAVQPLMGLVMKEVRGKADGKLVMDILQKKIKS